MFVVLKHVYIPLLFFSGVDYIDAPTSYMMGLHSAVDTSHFAMDGVHFFFCGAHLFAFIIMFLTLCYLSCLVVVVVVYFIFL